MKIHGSLFLWVPTIIFLLYLGINNTPKVVSDIILLIIYICYCIINVIAVFAFSFSREVRDDTRTAYNNIKFKIKEIIELLLLIIVIPLILIPFITYFLNDKLTVKI